MRDELYGRFEATFLRAEAKRHPLCPRCGEQTDCHHSRYGECHNCGGTHRLDFHAQAIVWREAVATRARGEITARCFFNRLTLIARADLMRELTARQQAASAGMGKVTRTMRWLEQGLKPHVL